MVQGDKVYIHWQTYQLNQRAVRLGHISLLTPFGASGFTDW